VPGKVGQAFSFDGVDDFVQVPGMFGGGPELTIEAWIRIDGTQPSFQSIVSSPAPGEFVHLQTAQSVGSSGNVAVYTDTNPALGMLLDPIPQTPTGAWRHVAISVRSGETRLYVQGSLLDSGGEVFSQILATSDLRIGGTLPLGGRFFKGAIDEVTIYDRALTEAEIQDILAADAAGKCKVTTVPVDIKPGSAQNRINPNSRGRITVAILTGGAFDATAVDDTTVLFGQTGTEATAVHAVLEDVDGDLDVDMVLQFRTQDTGIECGDTAAALTGATFGGLAIAGSDAITTVGCP